LRWYGIRCGERKKPRHLQAERALIGIVETQRPKKKRHTDRPFYQPSRTAYCSDRADMADWPGSRPHPAPGPACWGPAHTHSHLGRSSSLSHCHAARHSCFSSADPALFAKKCGVRKGRWSRSVCGEFKALRDRLRREQRRAALFEYALLVSVVALAALAVISAVCWPNGMWANIVSGKAI